MRYSNLFFSTTLKWDLEPSWILFQHDCKFKDHLRQVSKDVFMKSKATIAYELEVFHQRWCQRRQGIIWYKWRLHSVLLLWNGDGTGQRARKQRDGTMWGSIHYGKNKGCLEYCVKSEGCGNLREAAVPVQGIPPCPRINRYKRAPVFREQPVCVCSLSAHLYMTHRKKRWGVEVIGKSPLGSADPDRVLYRTSLPWKVVVRLPKETL